MDDYLGTAGAVFPAIIMIANLLGKKDHESKMDMIPVCGSKTQPMIRENTE